MTPLDPPHAGDNPYPDGPADQAPNGTVAVAPISQAEIDMILAPHTVDMRTWLYGIMSTDDFPESDPDAMALGMLAQILTATSSAEALAMFSLDRARDMCGNEPGGKSGVIEIFGARALKSTYAEGAACYSIISAVRLTDGERFQFTTGSKAVQMMIWKHMYQGWMPFKAMLEIRKEKTQRGFYPLNLVAGI
jgi:hypothetical protein